MRRVHLARSYRAAVMALGPVGFWPLSEASGTVARDETGINDGTYVNAPTLGVPGLLAGDPNTAVTFNGTTQDVTVAGSAGLAVGDTFSFVTFVRLVTASRNNPLLSRTGVGGALIYINSTNRAQFDVVSVGNIFAGGPTFSVGTAYMVAVTKAGATVRLYVDGADVTPTITNQTCSDSASTALLLGGDANFGLFLAGTQARSILCKRALTPAEIARLYQIGRGF